MQGGSVVTPEQCVNNLGMNFLKGELQLSTPAKEVNIVTIKLQ